MNGIVQHTVLQFRTAFKRRTCFCRAVVFALVASVGMAKAADRGTTRFWNLTGETVTHLNMAPAGTTDWGPDQLPK